MSSRPKILLVDDDHDTLDLLEIILYKHYDVITAMNGFEGLKKVDEEAPDLIITDIMMPVMNGISFFNSLKKSSVARNVPVVAVTSFSREYPAKSLTNMGFSGIIAKPSDKAAVIELLARLLSRSKTPDTPASAEEPDS
ncbi:MAG: response regulator [Chitinispirillaceae bacterium]|jgi:CheY-like chemotaxis protein